MSSVSEARRREALRRASCFFRNSASRGVMSDILAEMRRLSVLTILGFLHFDGAISKMQLWLL